MSQVPVKYVHANYMNDTRLRKDFIPVIPLSAMREVVEGLVQINTEMHLIKQNNQGGYVGDKEACKRTAAIAQRLLASLGEVGK